MKINGLVSKRTSTNTNKLNVRIFNNGIAPMC